MKRLLLGNLFFLLVAAIAGCSWFKSKIKSPEIEQAAVAHSEPVALVKPTTSSLIEGAYGWKFGQRVDQQSGVDCKPDSSLECKPFGKDGQFKGAFSVLSCDVKPVNASEIVVSMNACLSPISRKIFKLNVTTNIRVSDADRARSLGKTMGDKYGQPSQVTPEGLIVWARDTTSIIISPMINFVITYTDYNAEDEAIAEIKAENDKKSPSLSKENL